MDNEETSKDDCRAPEGDIKKDLEKFVDVLFPPESRQHMLKAATEVVLALDAAIPKGMVPQEVKDQYEVVKKETVSLVKTVVHAAKHPDECCQDSDKKEEKGLQKIEFS